MTRHRILGVPTDPVTVEEMMQHIKRWIAENDRPHQICTINPEFIIMAQGDAAFYEILQQSDL